MVLIHGTWCKTMDDALDVVSDKELAEGLRTLLAKDRERVRREERESIVCAPEIEYADGWDL